MTLLSQAPLVRLPFGRATAHVGLVLGLGTLNFVLLRLLWLEGADPVALGGLVLAFGLVFFLAALAWWKTPSSTLEWNGAAWHWSGWPQEDDCRVQWLMALPGFSVLRLHSGGGLVHCLIVGPAGHQDPSWPALRRALIANREQGHGR